MNNKIKFCPSFKEPWRTHIGDANPDGCPLAAQPQRLSGMVLVTVSQRPNGLLVGFPPVSHSEKRLMQRDFLGFFSGYLGPSPGMQNGSKLNKLKLSRSSDILPNHHTASWSLSYPLPEVGLALPLSPTIALTTWKCVWKQLCRWPPMFYRKYYLNIEKDHISPVRNYRSGFHFLSHFFPSSKAWEKKM